MDGENKGKAYFLMDDLGGFPIFLETPSSSFALDRWLRLLVWPSMGTVFLAKFWSLLGS